MQSIIHAKFRCMALAVLYSIEAVKLNEVLGGYIASRWCDQMTNTK